MPAALVEDAETKPEAACARVTPQTRENVFPFRFNDPENFPDVLEALPLHLTPEQQAALSAPDQPLTPEASIEFSNLGEPLAGSIFIEVEQEEIFCQQYFDERGINRDVRLLSPEAPEERKDIHDDEPRNMPLDEAPSMAELYEKFCSQHSSSSSEETQGRQMSTEAGQSVRSPAQSPLNVPSLDLSRIPARYDDEPLYVIRDDDPHRTNWAPHGESSEGRREERERGRERSGHESPPFDLWPAAHQEGLMRHVDGTSPNGSILMMCGLELSPILPYVPLGSPPFSIGSACSVAEPEEAQQRHLTARAKHSVCQ
ncbi:hypothetical protein CYMTET_14250 [Cymbomonas tetramitiformis]|uniref:Uncharacterized protein n=1 Tax=Cymbomonas tetramitiformis TaxID=36881 RepID=A0AAE0GGR7_9CHLO|nr:hypothetical protein CYMTET_14250 [Cymbomonas tetramitiformis]